MEYVIVFIVVTPPQSKVKKPVSASGILALTQSPLLYKGKKASVTKETPQSDGEMISTRDVWYTEDTYLNSHCLNIKIRQGQILNISF